MSTIGFGTPLGDKLYELAKQNNIKICLEIGTADATGSTHCIAQGLKETGGILFTIEADPEIIKTAMKNIEKYNLPVFFLSGAALSSEYLKDWSFYEEELTSNKYLPSNLLEEMKRRYEMQKGYYHREDSGSLIELCESIAFFDLVFLDGGTFTAFDEMLLLQDKITEYLVLDDTNPSGGGRKNVKTRIELLKATNWQILDDNYEDRTGWMALKKSTPL